IGPGVWDIHSPRAPSQEEIAEQLRRARAVVGPGRLWVNPDCALKTRGHAETEASLRHLHAAAREARAEARAPLGARPPRPARRSDSGAHPDAGPQRPAPGTPGRGPLGADSRRSWAI